MEKRSPHRGKSVRRVLSLGALLVTVGFAPAAFADLVPGGGKTAGDCLVELDVTGLRAATVAKGKTVTCTDGDPCDSDGACDGTCTFEVSVCANQTDPALADCIAPASLTKPVTAKSKGLTPPLPAQSGANCGDPFNAKVAAGKKLKIKTAGKQASKPKSDKDKFTLSCLARSGDCPPAVICGDGQLGAGEQCDPPCGRSISASAVGCGDGQLCNSECRCVQQEACACGSPDPMQTAFRTIDGTGTCGEVVDVNGMSLSVNDNDTPGLNCSGLYFGGRANAVPLPNSVPNNGMSIANVCCSGTELTAFGATAFETGSERNCTSTGCLFGSPLPVINPTTPGTSTCVINRLSSPAVGKGDCKAGTSELTAPLSSEIFLAGDTLFRCLVGDTTPPGLTCSSDEACGPGGICPTGIQPCPVCRGAAGTETCFGGPNNGMACTPEATTPGEGYPTSHDCPPDPMNTIGSLPISFTLSTGTIERTARQIATPRVFCGFCRDKGTAVSPGTLCFEGNKRFSCQGGPNNAKGCTTLGADPACAGGTCVTNCPEPLGKTKPCNSKDDCAEPYESCEQNEPGAFAPGGGTAQTIRVFGSAAGDVTDRQEHPATLAGVFCIPPTYDPLIDNAANLPGPGAVSLPGFVQLTP
jgi:hypothetical protein